jgi:TonB family protein
LGGLGAPVPGGPTGPGGNSGPSSGGGQLESAQVQQVVSRYTPSVKRSCWQPALDTRDKDAGSSARVVVSIQVGASGSVQNASTSGDPRGYRGLASCILGRVRGWQFPASGGSTTVNVPFVFVAQ